MSGMRRGNNFIVAARNRMDKDRLSQVKHQRR